MKESGSAPIAGVSCSQPKLWPELVPQTQLAPLLALCLDAAYTDMYDIGQTEAIKGGVLHSLGRCMGQVFRADSS